MDLIFQSKISDKYNSKSQKIRVLTESWVSLNLYCPNCGNLDISKYSNNKPVADFYCQNCKEDYELKSNKNKINNKVVDGAYESMLKRLKSQNNPNLFLMQYSSVDFKIINFIVIPKYFFTPQIIEKRNPLSLTARRAGWVGCNIILKNIPKSGKIFFIKDGVVKKRNEVLKEWKKVVFLKKQIDLKAKGWLLDIMICIENIKNKEFSLKEVYNFESYLALKYPNNRHIKDKIRQQIQVLRDNDYLEFTKRGFYKIK